MDATIFRKLRTQTPPRAENIVSHFFCNSNRCIFAQTKNAPVTKNRGMKFRYRDSPEYPGTYTLWDGWRRSRGKINCSIDSPLTLLLGFWCSAITLLLFRTFSIAPWLDSELAFVADSGLWIGHCIGSGGWKPLRRRSAEAPSFTAWKNPQLPKQLGIH